MRRSAIHKSRRQATSRRRSRRGAILVVALICLTLSTLLLGSLLKSAILHRKQMRYEEYRLQAEWLAESGLERTADRLAENADYPGESWRIDADQFNGQHAALVTINIDRPKDRPGIRIAKIVATYPANVRRYTRRTMHVEFQIENR